jgi:hypothetical protein
MDTFLAASFAQFEIILNTLDIEVTGRRGARTVPRGAQACVRASQIARLAGAILVPSPSVMGARPIRAFVGRLAVSASIFVTMGSASARADQVDACVDAAEQAQRLRRDGKLRGARERLMTCSQAQCVSAVRADCTKWRADLEAMMPSVVIRAVDGEGADLADVRVYVDDELIAARLDGNDLPVDPGEHEFRFVRERSAPVQQRVLVRQGEQRRILSVVFPEPVHPPAPPLVARSGAQGDFHIEAAWPITVLGVGLGALAVASTLWISGAIDHASMASSCAPTHTCLPSEVDSAHRTLVIGDVVGGAGLGLLAIGGGLLAVSLSARPAQSSPSHRAPGSALVSLVAWF